MHVFIAMESDYDGAWIYGVYTTLDAAMQNLTDVSRDDPKYSLNDRYMFVEEWAVGGGERIAKYDYHLGGTR